VRRRMVSIWIQCWRTGGGWWLVGFAGCKERPMLRFACGNTGEDKAVNPGLESRFPVLMEDMRSQNVTM